MGEHQWGVSFAADIEAVAGEEPILSAVIGNWEGNPPEWDFNEEDRIKIPEVVRGKVIPWLDAWPLLNYPYDSGFGCKDCHAIHAWTPTRVLLVSNYDGAIRIVSVPRHPSDGYPEMAGS